MPIFRIVGVILKPVPSFGGSLGAFLGGLLGIVLLLYSIVAIPIAIIELAGFDPTGRLSFDSGKTRIQSFSCSGDSNGVISRKSANINCAIKIGYEKPNMDRPVPLKITLYSPDGKVYGVHEKQMIGLNKGNFFTANPSYPKEGKRPWAKGFYKIDIQLDSVLLGSRGFNVE